MNKNKILILILILFISLIPLSVVKAIPYDSWNNYKILNFNDGFEGLQVNFNVTYGYGDNGLSFNCQEDFEDLRFFNYENDILLYAYNETTINKDYCEIWLKLGTSKNVTMRYNNPEANSYWDLENTFEDVIDGVVLALPMNEGSGNLVDYSGLGNNFVITETSVVDGYFVGSNARYFDGVNDFAQGSAISAYQFGVGNYSFCMWLKLPNDVQGSERIIFRVDDENDIPRRIFDLQNDQFDRATLYDSGVNKLTIPTKDLTDDVWHFVFVNRNSDVLSLSVDNVSVGSISGCSALVASVALDGHAYFGSYENAHNRWTEMSISNFLMFNKTVDSSVLFSVYPDSQIVDGLVCCRVWVNVMPICIFGVEFSKTINDAILIGIFAFIIAFCALLLILIKKK